MFIFFLLGALSTVPNSLKTEDYSPKNLDFESQLNESGLNSVIKDGSATKLNKP